MLSRLRNNYNAGRRGVRGRAAGPWARAVVLLGPAGCPSSTVHAHHRQHPVPFDLSVFCSAFLQACWPAYVPFLCALLAAMFRDSTSGHAAFALASNVYRDRTASLISQPCPQGTSRPCTCKHGTRPRLLAIIPPLSQESPEDGVSFLMGCCAKAQTTFQKVTGRLLHNL